MALEGAHSAVIDRFVRLSWSLQCLFDTATGKLHVASRGLVKSIGAPDEDALRQVSCYYLLLVCIIISADSNLCSSLGGSLGTESCLHVCKKPTLTLPVLPHAQA
jgi:hypothetical protein